MDLIVDIGNTKTKLAIVDNDNIKVVQNDLIKYTLSGLRQLMYSNTFENCIVSSTSNLSQRITDQLSQIGRLYWLNSALPYPLKNMYQTKDTLGNDRIAAAVGARTRFPGQDCMVIDMGTCITMDFVNKKGHFLGGNISPGIQMRILAMNKFTDKLPLIKAKMTNQVLGTSTETALQNGAVRGALYEIEATIEAVKAAYGEINVILTGGDAVFFESWSKNVIFAFPNLVIEGLNEILKYNVKKK